MLKALRDKIDKRLLTPTTGLESELDYWRERTFLTIFFVGVLFGTLIYAPSVIYLVFAGDFRLAALETVVWLACVYLFFAPGLSYRLKAFLLVALIYGMGIAVFVARGPLSAGPLWLFIFPLLTGVLLGKKQGLGALAMNTLALGVFWLLADQQWFPWQAGIDTPPFRLMIISVNFMFINTLALFLTVNIVSTIDDSNKQLRQAVSRLEQENAGRRRAEEHLNRGEKALRESEARFRDLARLLPETIYETDLEGNLTFVNENAFAQFGYTRQEFDQGLNALNMIAPEDRARGLENITKILAGRDIGLKEYTALRKDGATFPALFHSTAIVRDGKPVGLRGFIVDITERKRADEAVRQSKKELDTIIKHSNELFYIHDTDHQLTYASPTSEDILGYTPEEMMIVWTELATDNPINQRGIEITEKALAMRERQEPYLLELKKKDGEAVLLEVDESPIFDAKGKVVGICGAARDVTARIKSEALLRQSEEQFRLLAEAMTDMVWTVDINFQTTYVSPSVEKMLGFSPAERMRQSLEEMVTPDSIQRIQETFARELPFDTGGADPDRSLKMEVEYYRKDGSTVWVENVVKVIKDAGGEIIGLHGVSRDISDRKRAEDKVKESEERFRTLVEYAPDAIVVLDGDTGKFVDVNQNAEQLFGLDAEELFTKTPPDVSPRLQPDGCSSVEAAGAFIQEALDGGIPVFEWTHLNLAANREVPCEVRLVRLPSSSRNLVRGSVTDISDRKLAEEDKVRLESQLRQAQKMEAVGTLAGGIAHDFNNILAAVMGFSELGLDAAAAGKATSNEHEQVLKAAGRAKKLVQQILAFSRKAESELKPVNINREITSTVPLIERTIPKMISVELHLVQDLQLVNGDSNQIEQVLLNLASNAVDAMPNGGKLVIETENVTLDQEYADSHLEALPGNYILITVSDTGQGMDKDAREKIFDPFYTTKEVGKGTGLGLASVYGIVKGHGGHIMCYSEPGMGTTFRIYLPALESVDAYGADDNAEVDINPGGTETILLVDDEEALRGLGSRNLTGNGYQVVTANSGEEALAIYGDKGVSIDLVILDISMPGMGGHKALKEILSINPEAKVIIASGYTPKGQVKDTLESGAAGYIAKPFKMAELLNTVRGVLDG